MIKATFMGVTDLNLNVLRYWVGLEVSHHVLRQIGVRITHGTFTYQYIPSLCAALSFQISDQDVFASRSISLLSFCTTDLSRIPPRHRILSARSPTKLYANNSFAAEQEQTVYALDTTTIDLFLSVFPWVRRDYPQHLRRVKFYDAEHDRHLVFLTNNLDLPALTIAKLYHCRWQIELFFKWIKQHLRIKKF